MLHAACKSSGLYYNTGMTELKESPQYDTHKKNLNIYSLFFLGF